MITYSADYLSDLICKHESHIDKSIDFFAKIGYVTNTDFIRQSDTV